MVATLTALVAGLAAPAAPAAIDQPIGQWLFDEPDGQLALDGGPFGLHGVLGATDLADPADPARIAGRAGGALHFNGTSYVHLPSSGPLAVAQLTVEAIVRGSASPGPYRYVMSRGSRGCFSGTYGMYSAAAGGIAFYIFDGERYHVSATARPSDVWNGDWHAVTGVFDGSRVRLFLDGAQVGEPLTTPADTAIDYDQAGERAYFGTYIGSCTLPFVGDVDSIRMWSGGKTAEEVAAAAGASPAATPRPVAAVAGPEVITPASPPPSVVSVSVSPRTIRVGRRTVITVNARRNGKPLARARVEVRRAGKSKLIAHRRTDAKGRARIRLKVSRAGRLKLTLPGRKGYRPAYVMVKR